MANFNQNVPQINAPSYLGYSQPISPVEGDTSAGIGLKGVGELFKGALSGADDIIKGVIDRGLRQSLTQERDIQTGALEQMAGVPVSQRVSPYVGDATATDSGNHGTASSSPYDIIPGATPPVPGELQTSLPAAVESVQNGKMLKPQLNTYYTGKLDMIAKDYRSQYPGWSDYIDQRVSAITGGNPANERIKDMVAMLAVNATNTSAEKEKALGFVGSNSQYPGAANAATVISSGITNPMAYAINWVSEHKAIDYKVDTQIKANTLWKGTNENLVLQNEQSAAGIANDVSTKAWADTVKAMGVSGADLFDTAQKVATGAVSIDDKQAEAYGQAVNAMGINTRRAIEDKLNKKGEDGRSIADIIGPTKTKQILDQATDRYVQLGDMFLNKDKGSAFQSARYVTIHDNQTSKWLLSESPIKDYMGFMAAANRMGGPAVAGQMAADFIGGKMGSLDDAVKEYGKFNGLKLMTTPNAPLASTIEEAKAKGLGADPNQAPQRVLYDYFTNDLPAKIADKTIKPEARIQLAKNVFTGDTPVKFDKDTFDAKGNLIPGMHTVFNNMTTDKIRDSVWELSDNGKNPLWIQYKNWITKQTSTLLNGDIHDISSLSVNPNIVYTWDTEKHQFGLQAKDGFFTNAFVNSQAGTQLAQKQLEQYKQQLAMVNASIQPLVGVALKEGTDPNAFVLRQMINNGLTIRSGGPMDPRGVQGIPQQLMDALAGPAPKEPQGDAQGPPDKRASLTGPSWTVNPGAAFDNKLKEAGTYLKNKFLPTLQDWTKPDRPAAGNDQIVGTANAAHISQTWGNPFSPTFKDEHLTEVATPSGQKVQVNKYAAPAFEGFLKDLEATGYKINDIGGYSLRESKSGGVSQHAFGNAIDINPPENPFLKGASKAKTDMPKNISELAAKWGLTWGGDWHSVKDAMHFEYTGKKPKQGDPGFKLAGK